jgi:hypothetical protein
MKHTSLRALAALGISLFLTVTGLTAQPENLLKNPDFTTVSEGKPASWQFSLWNLTEEQKTGGQVLWSAVKQGADSNALAIQTSSPVKAHLWWQQSLPVSGSGNYRFSVKVKLATKTPATRATLNVGLYFLGEGKRWLNFDQLKAPSKPGADWIELSGLIAAPEEAATVTARLGVDFNGEIEFLIKDPVLTLVQ